MNEIKGSGEEFEKLMNKALFDYFSKHQGIHRFTDDPKYTLNVSMVFSPNDIRIQDWPFKRLKKDFGFPVLHIFSGYDDERAQTHLLTSPYEEIPSIVADSSGEVYFVDNVYFLSSEGKAIKLEDISIATNFGDTLEEKLRDLGEDLRPGVIKKLDFNLNESIRFVNLNADDYNKLRDFVNLLKSKDESAAQ